MLRTIFHVQTDGEIPEGAQLPQLIDHEDQRGESDDGRGENQGGDEDDDDDFDDSNPPLLFVDVNLGANE